MEDVAGISQTLLGPIIQGLLEKLVSREVLNYARREGIDTQLKNLAQKLPEIGAVLGDAEMKQMTNDGVKKWVDELSDLAYDLDDLLDDFATQEALLMTESEASTGNKTSSEDLCIKLSSHDVKFHSENGQPEEIFLSNQFPFLSLKTREYSFVHHKNS